MNTYRIEGMTCNGCVARVKSAIENLEEVASADIQLSAPQAKIKFYKPLKVNDLQEVIGKYKIEVVQEGIIKESIDLPNKSIQTYRPLLMIVGFILGVSLLAQYPFNDFSAMLLMRHFMAGFFIVFSFFKLLNVKGFAESYQMYDIVAARWKGWAYIYPFVELGLGIAYLINFAPFATNIITLVVLGVSSIGVIKSNLDKRTIKCACLGDVFNLPMSTVTIVEDLTMVGMAAIMLFFL